MVTVHETNSVIHDFLFFFHIYPSLTKRLKTQTKKTVFDKKPKRVTVKKFIKLKIGVLASYSEI